MAVFSKNIIPLLVKQLARILRCGVLPEGTYLAGGTAVYFYLRHRVSVDLDFFTRNEFSAEIFLYRMKECFDEVAVELMGKDTVILYLGPEKLKFSLFYLPYGLLSRVHEMPIDAEITCPLASLNDIAAMKAIAINQRGSMKDFVDFFFILDKTGMDFNDVAGLVTRKYNLDQDYNYQLKTSFFWDRSIDQTSSQIIIERAINFGGFDFIKEVQEKYGMEKFVHTLKHNRNLGKKVVNYWCLKLSIDRNSTKTFQNERIWDPF